MESIANLSQTILQNTASTLTGSKSDRKCPDCGRQRKVIEVDCLGRKKQILAKCECELQEYEKLHEDQEARAQQVKLDRMKSYSLMDRKFEICTLENWDDSIADPKLKLILLEYVNTWHDNYQKGLGMILHGKPGTGKTYAVFALANNLMEMGKPVMVISSIGILNRIKDSYSSGDSEHDILKALRNASLLVIDDLGAEHYTDWSASILYRLIDDRYRTKRPMVITTNLSLQDLENKLSTDGIPRAYSRLDEVCVPVHVCGESIRKKKGEQEKRSFRERVINIMRGSGS